MWRRRIGSPEPPIGKGKTGAGHDRPWLTAALPLHKQRFGAETPPRAILSDFGITKPGFYCRLGVLAHPCPRRRLELAASALRRAADVAYDEPGVLNKSRERDFRSARIAQTVLICFDGSQGVADRDLSVKMSFMRCDVGDRSFAEVCSLGTVSPDTDLRSALSAVLPGELFDISSETFRRFALLMVEFGAGDLRPYELAPLLRCSDPVTTEIALRLLPEWVGSMTELVAAAEALK